MSLTGGMERALWLEGEVVRLKREIERLEDVILDANEKFQYRGDPYPKHIQAEAERIMKSSDVPQSPVT